VHRVWLSLAKLSHIIPCWTSRTHRDEQRDRSCLQEGFAAEDLHHHILEDHRRRPKGNGRKRPSEPTTGKRITTTRSRLRVRGKWFKSRKPIPASSIHNDPISPAGARGKWFKSRKPIPASSIGESASSIGVQELVPWDDAISAVGSKMRELRESKEEILLLRSASALSDGAFEVLGQWSRRVALPLSGGQDGGAPMCRSATMGLDRRSGGRAPAALARGCPWQVVQEPKADACVEHRRGATI
jgi:hypothetical protein